MKTEYQWMTPWWLLCGLCLLWAMPTLAQEKKEDQNVLTVTVDEGTFVQIQLAVPPALNQGDGADEMGVTEALSGTVDRDLRITGFFNLLDPNQVLANSKKEGMNPVYADWFNSGAQGLVKIGFKVQGDTVLADMRLYSVDGSERVKLPKPYDGPVQLPMKTSNLRNHAHGFANEVIQHYTKSKGFFGSHIVLVKRTGKSKDVYMVSADGMEETRLTKAGGINMLPSMGAGRVYFTSFRSGRPHAYALQNRRARPFSKYKGLNTGAVLSPDGRSVAITLSKDGNPEIYLLDPDDGSVQARLTRSWGIDTSPAWSPDGTQIAFVSDRQGSPQIYVMNADGSNQRRLTFQGDYNQTPDWSPKGDLIAFTARDERAVFDIFTVRVSDGLITRLTQNQGNNEEPTWSPDGRFLAFVSTRKGKSKLYVSSKDGRYQTRISTGKGAYYTPYWVRY